MGRSEDISYLFLVVLYVPSVCVGNKISFRNVSRMIELSELSPKGTKVSLGSVTHQYEGGNGIWSCSIVTGNEKNDFRLETKQSENDVLYMELVDIALLDYETNPFYSLHIRANDGESPPVQGDIHVSIALLDENDNAPIFTFTNYSADIEQDVQVGTNIIQVIAIDPDSGENGRITYSIDREKNPHAQFSIDPKTGIIRISIPVVNESRTKYKLSVTARDNGSPALAANADVEVNVIN